MAEPWSNDFQALEAHTRQGLPRLLPPPPQETKMRYFKSHPALAALVMLLLLGLVGGAAYAVVREVFITIDPDKPADQIEKDVHDQLEAAGVPATVHAEKVDDGKLKIRIGSVDKNLGTDVKISPKRRGRGIIAMQYYSNDDLARLLELILGRPFDG